MADSLPRFLVLGTSTGSQGRIYLRYVNEKGTLQRRLRLSSLEVASERNFTKLEVVRAHAGTGRQWFHIRSTYNNKFLVLESEGSQWCIAGADEPEEDRSKWSCTMFRTVFGLNNRVSFLLQSGGAEHPVHVSSLNNCLNIVNTTSLYWFEVTDMSTLAILPKHVAFKGDNNLYLSSRYIRTRNRLQFASNNLLDSSVHQETFTLNNGNVRLRSHQFGQFWRKSNPEWIWCDTTDTTANNADTVFRPQRLGSNGNTIALLNLGNNKYCMRWIRGGQPRLIGTLTASATSVVPQAVFEVEEAIREREIYDIRYNMDEVRIYNVAPVTNGTLVRVTYNWSETETAVKQLTFSHTHVSQEYFNSSHSWKLAYQSTLKVTVIPKLVNGTVQIDASYEGSVEWSKMNEDSYIKTTTLFVRVPPMTRSEVTLMVQRGSINVPFSYTQRDTLLDYTNVISYLDDGIYTGLDTEVVTHIIREQSLDNMSPSELEEARRESDAQEAASARPSKL